MSRKSILSAVSVGNVAFEVTTRRIIAAGQQQQLRSFTSTSQRNAHITHFTPTSSPALDDLLNDIRNKIILPSYLPQAQRKKIYSQKWEKKLQADPITIEIDGEILKFRYKNQLTDLPNTRKSLMAAIEKFETVEDFANLKPLFEGITYAGRKLESCNYAKVVRIVGDRGHIYEIIDCARSVKKTGFKLDTSEKVNEVLHFVQLKALAADWEENQTKQALRWAEMVVEMLHEEGHQPKRTYDAPIVEGEIPLVRDPMVLAAPLHLAAVLAARYEAGEEVLDKVNKYARDILAVWPEDKKLKELQPAEMFGYYKKLGYLNSPNKFVTLAVPLLHGLETAVKVVKPELASQLQTRSDTLKAEINEARETLLEDARGPARGQIVYQKFYGEEA